MPFRLVCQSCVCLLACVTALSQQAHVGVEKKTIKTYPFSDPDPIPIFIKDARIYPYFAFDGYTDAGSDREWSLIRLENDHIRASVLPDVGGKVFGAVEKSTGKEFIYQNDVLKFRRIALRGPWTSGGIEFNFGVVGHAPSTATPVDYTTRRNPDGSVTCFVGSIDLPSRTRWTVAITLPKDGAYLETKAFWYNPTPDDQSYYSWSTSAVRTAEDLRYVYPGSAMVQHGESVPSAPWPVDERGRDLSYYRNNDFEGSKSYFVYGERADHFGVWWENEKFGMGHWSLYDDMPGRKIWIWSLFRDGAIWDNLLTDTKGQYSEPQAGRLLSQSDHEFFPPYTGDTWRELWFPVKDIGGITVASPYAVLNVDRTTDSLRLGICALQELRDELAVGWDGDVSTRVSVTMKPMETRTLSLRIRGQHVRVTLGGDKLMYDEDPATRTFTRPIEYSLPPENSPDGLFRVGEVNEKQREYDRALDRYLACLRGEPNHSRALIRMAGLYGRRGEYRTGLEYAAKALKLSKFDPAANYRYGVLARAAGQLVDAKEALTWAARSLEFRSNAYCQLGEIALIEQSPETSLEYARRSLEFNALNVNALLCKAIALRKLGRSQEAGDVLARLLEFDPLNHQARFEQELNSAGTIGRDVFPAFIRTEIQHETFLEITAAYARLDLCEEALSVLDRCPDVPMAWYWRAYLRRTTDTARASKDLSRAGSLSPAFVFPFREEELPILEWAAAQRPSEWKPRYYLALVLWAKGRKDEALKWLELCDDASYAPVFTARAYLKKELRKTPTEPDLEKALSLDRRNWRNWHHYVSALTLAKNHRRALEVSREAHSLFPDQVEVRMDIASALYNNGEYNECLELLRMTRVLPYEGSWEAHDLFVRAYLRSALNALDDKLPGEALERLASSREYPEHLGSGRPFEPDQRVQDLLSSIAHAMRNEPSAAKAFLDSAASYTLRHRFGWGSEHLFGLISLERSGRRAEAKEFAREWAEKSPNDPLRRWWQARKAGNRRVVKQIETAAASDPRLALRLAAAGLVRP